MATGRRRRRRRASCASPWAASSQRVADEHGGLHVPCPPGYLPRAALGALIAPLVRRASTASGLAPGAHAQLVMAQQQLGAPARRSAGPRSTAPANPARELARRIGRTIPLVYGGGALGAVAAYRWKCDINENAKAPAFSHIQPELGHNEICAWGQHGDVTRQLMTLDRAAPRLRARPARAAFRRDAREIDRRSGAPGAHRRGRGRRPARAAARPDVPRRLRELLPRARQRRRPRPDRRDLRAEAPPRRTTERTRHCDARTAQMLTSVLAALVVVAARSPDSGRRETKGRTIGAGGLATRCSFPSPSPAP